MGRGDQAAENLDQFQTAPFPRLKAEHFRRAAMEAAAPECPSQKSSTGALQILVLLAQGIVGLSEHYLKSLVSAPAL